VTVSIEEIYILVEDPSVSVFVEEAYGVGIDVDETTVNVTSDDISLIISPQETTLLISEIGIQGPPGEEDVAYDLEVDDSSTPTRTYIGQAIPGTSVASPAWRIKLITESGAGTSINWADGTAAFSKVWDDRLDYTYAP